MTEISPAAQAVYEAAWAAYWLKDAEHPADAELIAAAALRAAAIYAYCPVDRQRLTAIAEELEAQQKNRHHSAMNISEAINVMESVAGVTDESTSVGEAWAVILSHVMHSQKRKDVNPRSENA